MSRSASSAADFYRDVAKLRVVWAIRDAGGFPAPVTSSGQRAMPFWSTKNRALRLVASAAAYSGFTVVELSWEDFAQNWLPGLEQDGLLVGVNWSGDKATGYDLPPSELRRNVEHAIASTAKE